MTAIIQRQVAISTMKTGAYVEFKASCSLSKQLQAIYKHALEIREADEVVDPQTSTVTAAEILRSTLETSCKAYPGCNCRR